MRILVIDDHALFRDGLKLLLQQLSDTLVVNESQDCEAGIDLAQQEDFDLVLIDLKMPGYNNLESLLQFRAACPEIPTVVLSGEDSPVLVRSAIKEGAMGFITKSSSHEILIQALNLVLHGGVYLPPNVLEEPESSGDKDPELSEQQLSNLTRRQLEVLKSLIHGKPNKVIARELNMSEHTVKSHLSVVFDVLKASNRTEAVYKAAKLGIPLI